MLCLGRKEGEGIVIGDETRVVVYDIGRGRCRLAVEAAKDVQVRRFELDPLFPRSEAERALCEFFAAGRGAFAQRFKDRFPMPPGDEEVRRFVRRPGSLLLLGEAS